MIDVIALGIAVYLLAIAVPLAVAAIRSLS